MKLLAASKRQNIAYAAKRNLERLDRGDALAKEVPYQVQSWTFGKDLAMVFLPGEVTVDYQLRLKMEFDHERLWVNAYANDAPCYIPSRKVLAEGGFEGESAMVYYDQPAKFAPGAEDLIVAAVYNILPAEFLASYRADIPPKSPADSLAAIQTRDDLGLVVELAAAEPFVADPVAIDWDTRGRMWVVEQPDYPNGMDGNWKPGGRVKILSDNDGDGRYERSELLLEGIPFPTGITCWSKGAYVCVARVLDALDRREIELASLSGAERLRPLFDAAHRIAADDTSNDSDRQAALRLFGRGFNDPAQDVPLLSEFLRPTVSDSIQKTVLAMLARSSSQEAAEAMLSDWSLRTPSVRASIITTLLGRDTWIQHLLQAVEDGVISPAEVTASNRQTLETHANEKIRQRALTLLPVADNSERAAAVEKYQRVAKLKGDAVHGATVFKTACAVCHDYLGQGMVVGPNLKAYYNKSVSDFVTAILDPSAAVEPRYVSYAITTRDKRTLVGVIANESAASLEVVQPGGIRETILRPDIESITATGMSLMPDGLEQAITPQDMADLIAYLKSGG